MSRFEHLLSALFASPDEVCIIGTGKQAREMRAFLAETLCLRVNDLPGYSSADAPVGVAHFLLCATPESAAIQTLVERGVRPDTLCLWSEVERFIRSSAGKIYHRHLGLRLPAERDDLHPPPGIKGAFRAMLARYNILLREIGYPDATWTFEQFGRLERLSDIYLSLRTEWQKLDGSIERRLLFPSTGRCGGLSITKALSEQFRIPLRVGHEELAGAIYGLLRLYRQGKLRSSVLTVVLMRLLDEYECLGGNPLCFLLPFLPRIPGYECHLLRVEREFASLRDSIVLRNFHYSSADFVPERITGAEWGDMSEAAWNALAIPQKVDWYIARVHTEIDRGAVACASVVRTPLDSIKEGLNSILRRLRWPLVKSVPHINTIPKDRVYTIEERIDLFKKEHAKL